MVSGNSADVLSLNLATELGTVLYFCVSVIEAELHPLNLISPSFSDYKDKIVIL